MITKPTPTPRQMELAVHLTTQSYQAIARALANEAELVRVECDQKLATVEMICKETVRRLGERVEAAEADVALLVAIGAALVEEWDKFDKDAAEVGDPGRLTKTASWIDELSAEVDRHAALAARKPT